MKIIYLALSFLSCLFLTTHATDQQEEDWITILVHGVVGLRSNFNMNTLHRLMRDCVEGSRYEKNVRAIRNNPYLFTMQPIQELGLHRVRRDCATPCAPYIYSLLYNNVLKNYYPKKTRNKYYTFGWGGLLSYKIRYNEGRIFYLALKKELEKLARKNFYPKIRIIGYSHGGTVGLQLSAVREKEFPEDTFQIEEYIAVGMPVLHTTRHLLFNPIFKNIYHVYSCEDMVQRIDIFSPCNIFSHRKFYGHLPPNLTQIEVRVRAKFLRIPGQNLPSRMRGNFNQSPGHSEFWFFGWAPTSYRKNYTFFPLPTSLFLPYIIETKKNLFPESNHIEIELRPDQELALVMSKHCRSVFTVPFLPRKYINRLKEKAMEFHPERPEIIDKYLTLKHNIPKKDIRN